MRLRRLALLTRAAIGLWLAVQAAALALHPASSALFKRANVAAWSRFALALVEIGAAVLWIVPRTRVVGAACLLAVFLGAAAVHGAAGYSPPPVLVLYAVVVSATFVEWRSPCKTTL